MSLGFIGDAMAAAPSGPSGNAGAAGFAQIAIIVLIFAVFYFLLIRPQSKRQKEHRKMIEALSKGDEIITNGGMLGRITQLDEQFLTVEIADGVHTRIQRNAIAALVPKGTFKP